MRKSVGALIVLGVFGFTPTVQAASVSLDLNCLWASGSCTYQSPSYGAITISDSGSNSNWITLHAVVTAPLDDIFNVYLNWSGSVSSGYGWYLQDGSGSSVTYSANAEGPDGKLDVAIDTGWAAPADWTGTLQLRKWNFVSWNYQNLDPSQFDVKDANGYYAFADVHDGTNLVIGAEDYTPPPPEVPEPASLMLLGSGLFGLAAAMRRRPLK